MSDDLIKANSGDVMFAGDLNIDDMDPNELLKALYEYRAGSEVNFDNGVVAPFRDVPKSLMHRLDGYYLSVLSV